MKADIHPDYRPVIFEDVAGEFKMLVSSTIPTKQTAKWDDGEEYPYVRVDISAASHPYFTGKQKFVDTAGRVEHFQKRFGGNYFGGK